MELLIGILLVAGFIGALVLFVVPEVFERPPGGRKWAYILGYGVLPVLFVLLLLNPIDPTPFVIALAVVGLIWLTLAEK